MATVTRAGRLVGLAAGLALVTVGCASLPSPSPTAPVEVRTIPLPDDLLYSSVAWLDHDRIVVDAGPFGGAMGTQSMSSLDPETGRLEPLPVPGRQGCRTQEPERPFRLPDGRLGYVVFCRGLARAETFTVHAVEPGAPTAERLGSVADYNPGQLSAAPDMSRIIFGWSSAICAGVAFAGPTGPEPLPPTTAGTGDHAFRVDQALTAEPCESTGRATDPAYSPDGQRIALVVSPASVGVEGFARIDAPWQLAVMAGTGGDPLTVLVDGLSRPGGLAWSPDGRWIAYALSDEGTDPGTYLVEVATGRVSRLTSTVLGGPTWSPDGHALAGLIRQRDGLTGGSVGILDMRAVTGG